MNSVDNVSDLEHLLRIPSKIKRINVYSYHIILKKSDVEGRGLKVGDDVIVDLFREKRE